MTKFTIKKGDFGSYIRATLQDADGAEIDFTGAEVVLCFQRYLEGGEYDEAIRGEGTIESSTDTTATVNYQFEEGDTDVSGTYRAEWEVTFQDGSIRTFPSDTYFLIIIIDDVR